jgi:Na+-driven multidrug efflux pump
MHTVAGNLVNAILDAIFIFPLGLGVSGAALATVTSEYVEATMRSLNFFVLLVLSIFTNMLNSLHFSPACIQVLGSVHPLMEAE